MSLKRYSIDLRNIDLKERTNLYNILEKSAFILSVDFKNIGLYEVFWDSSIPIEELVHWPKNAIITQI